MISKLSRSIALGLLVLGAHAAWAQTTPVTTAADSPPAAASANAAPAGADAAAPAADASSTPPAPTEPVLVGTDKISAGDTAWMLTSTALVLMMTIPGLALFYGGMVRKKNVLATLMQSFASHLRGHAAVVGDRLFVGVHARQQSPTWAAPRASSCMA